MLSSLPSRLYTRIPWVTVSSSSLGQILSVSTAPFRFWPYALVSLGYLCPVATLPTLTICSRIPHWYNCLMFSPDPLWSLPSSPWEQLFSVSTLSYLAFWTHIPGITYCLLLSPFPLWSSSLISLGISVLCSHLFLLFWPFAIISLG